MKTRTWIIGWCVSLCACAAFALIEQEGIAYVGFSVVTNLQPKVTILAAPYVNFTNAEEALPITKLVSVTGLTAGNDAETADMLVVYTPSNEPSLKYGTYRYYWLKKEDNNGNNGKSPSWKPLRTIIACVDTNPAVAPDNLSEVPVSQGTGFWIEKRNGTSEVIVKGRVYTNQTTVISNGLNLIGTGYPTPFDLNNSGQDWASLSSISNDEILVANEVGSPSSQTDSYRYRNGKWMKRKIVKKQIGTTSLYYTTEEFEELEKGKNPISDGVGFWYRRVEGEPFTFNPVPKKPKD